MNNKPAFPVHPAVNCDQFSGMSLRDYFAGQALQALIAKTPVFTNAKIEVGEREIPVGDTEEELQAVYDGLSVSAYCYADAMIAEREGASDE